MSLTALSPLPLYRGPTKQCFERYQQYDALNRVTIPYRLESRNPKAGIQTRVSFRR